MLDSFKLLENVLFEIEKNIKTRITAESLAKTVALSNAHLQRLFRIAFERPLASYVRSRKLADSLDSLLKTNLRIIDIAEEYGFEYEQSYIRAFKREYGATPGEARSAGHIIKITPPLQLTKKNKMGDGLFFGPEFVMVPTFHVIGRQHKIPLDASIEEAPKVAKDFWVNDSKNIENKVRDDIYIGLTRQSPNSTDHSHYLPSVPVRKHVDIALGLHTDTFLASLCARFHYVSQNSYFDLNRMVASQMYETIEEFLNDDGAGYRPIDKKLYFERIDGADYDGAFYKLEWYIPVQKKDA